MNDDGSDVEGWLTGVLGGDVTARVVVPLRDVADYDTISRTFVSVIGQTLAPTAVRVWTPGGPRS